MLIPTRPNGINPNTAEACNGDLKVRTITKNIREKIKGITLAMLFWDFATSLFWPSKLAEMLGYFARMGGRISVLIA